MTQNHVPASRAGRRAVVSELWLRGISYAHIAQALGCSLSTVRRDVASARAELQLDHLASLNQQIARSLAVWRLVQRSAWELFAHVDDRSVNKSAALNIVSQAEERIAKLEGTLAPGSLNAAALSEAWDILVEVLSDAGGTELQGRFLGRLQQRLHGSASGRQLMRTMEGDADEPMAETMSYQADDDTLPSDGFETRSDDE